MAKQQAKSDDEAESNYAMALGLPQAEAELRAWNEHQPDTARQLVDVGNFLDARHKHEVYEEHLAGKAWQIAVNLNPRLEEAHCRIASEQARIGHHEPAFRTFTRIIEAAESRDAPADRNNLIAWYGDRADVSLSWGDRSRRLNLPDASGVSRRHYEEALDDLRRGSRPFTDHESDRTMREKYLVLTAQVKMALGDLETDLRRPNEAAELFSQARNHIKGLSPERMQVDSHQVARGSNRLGSRHSP
ncbi:MAG: hypothetical protein WKF75_14120 [Singulisphaera sp.]